MESAYNIFNELNDNFVISTFLLGENKMIKQKNFKINNIPVILWGDESENIILAVHGMMSNKADVPIEILAKISEKYSYQVLSFDLPKHGDRKNEITPLNPEVCTKELNEIYSVLKEKWHTISLFTNSIGTYFSLSI